MGTCFPCLLPQMPGSSLAEVQKMLQSPQAPGPGRRGIGGLPAPPGVQSDPLHSCVCWEEREQVPATGSQLCGVRCVPWLVDSNAPPPFLPTPRPFRSLCFTPPGNLVHFVCWASIKATGPVHPGREFCLVVGGVGLGSGLLGPIPTLAI
ncbi:hypothetical protein KIL84_022727 [Mauremys mutica]|uniref:Uncharacterized protein n=1 Tax=Mauremys mutica TaxID=74926 RepID=A0A9D3WRB9_9SAUR|nr:hypothetical protein KIL84_022727 [Mauremys mutica]